VKQKNEAENDKEKKKSRPRKQLQRGEGTKGNYSEESSTKTKSRWCAEKKRTGSDTQLAQEDWVHEGSMKRELLEILLRES